ncbi:hypothetical protein [Lacisediminihabitans changchengi]|uniref:DUF1648 domain-containing protein n=1 Tax=Lacisediminihabitans changchengi TaxID=2787634 RepID=A0A934SK82_9MICO|nr:hypothetical protein [Lacisediminihabitans changchengi]MBK4348217.1 hypothetical protein [Lacisediminihabitans changchengi]
MTDNETTGRSIFGARRALALAVTVLPLVILLAAALALGPTLGPTLASHWSSLGFPDGYSGTWSSFVVVAAIVVALTVGSWVVLFRVRSRGIARIWVGMSVLVAAILALAWAVSAGATASASQPKHAELGWGLLALVAAVPLGAVVFWIIDGSSVPDRSERSVAPMPLRPGDRVAWIGRSGSVLFLWVGVVLMIGGVVLALVLSVANEAGEVWIAGAVTIIAGLAVISLADVTLSIDGRGLRLVSSLFRVPLFRIPLADVSGVAVETIDPLRWGGWGLRFSGSGRAYVTGRAEGLVVGRTNGAPTAITIPHASDAASVLEALIRR